MKSSLAGLSSFAVLLLVGACASAPRGASKPAAASSPQAPASAEPVDGAASPPQEVAEAEPASDREPVANQAAAGPIAEPTELVADRMAEPPPPAQPPTPTSTPTRVRRGGDLIVETPPRAPDAMQDQKRLRSHVMGAMSKGNARYWAGIPVPEFVELLDGTRELLLLDRTDDGYLAVYRDPYGASSCSLSKAINCSVSVRSYDNEGAVGFRVLIDDHWSAPTHLEVQDIHLADGVLYFNEGCQSYAREAKRRCSSLVALDPVKDRVLWRSKNLRSRGRFLVLDDMILSGYGFTAEKDFLYALDRKSGKTLAKLALPTAADLIRPHSPPLYQVLIYPDRMLMVQVERTGKKVKLRIIDTSEALER